MRLSKNRNRFVKRLLRRIENLPRKRRVKYETVTRRDCVEVKVLVANYNMLSAKFYFNGNFRRRFSRFVHQLFKYILIEPK